jgi:universal stress protein E
MNPIRNILVIVDPTAEQHPAIEKGALIAQKFEARMELYVCDTKASREARIAAHAAAPPDLRVST